MTFTLNNPISTGGDPSYDFVFYEVLRNPNLAGVLGIDIDHAYIDLSQNNVSWCRVFYWGDGIPDFNTNVDGLPDNVVGYSPEDDNYPIPAGVLYNNSGIAVDIDSIGCISPGSYPFIRIGDPGTGVDEGAQVDAIQVLP